MSDVKVLLVGGGKMGSALVSGWMKSGFQKEDILVIEPVMGIADRLSAAKGVKVVESLSQVQAFTPDIVAFAVKPQVLDSILLDYRDISTEEVLYLSIAAGKTLDMLQTKLGKDSLVVRAMPNLASIIGQGVSVAISNHHLSTNQLNIYEKVLNSIGEVFWIKDESLMDAVTAISGSGPAYFFLMMEAMVKTAIELGIPSELAGQLVKHTAMGSANLAGVTVESIVNQRVHVTSPGGTTEAALQVLMQDNALEELMKKAITKAAERSKKLK